MLNILEIIDKTGKKIHLTKERWSHIRRDHPEVELEEIENTILKPIKILKIDEDKYYYFHYKNNMWLIMTAYFVQHIYIK